MIGGQGDRPITERASTLGALPLFNQGTAKGAEKMMENNCPDLFPELKFVTLQLLIRLLISELEVKGLYCEKVTLHRLPPESRKRFLIHFDIPQASFTDDTLSKLRLRFSDDSIFGDKIFKAELAQAYQKEPPDGFLRDWWFTFSNLGTGKSILEWHRRNTEDYCWTLYPAQKKPLSQAATPAEMLQQGFTYGDDFRSVAINGRTFALTFKQARVIEVFYAASQTEHPWKKPLNVLAEIDSNSRTLSELFRRKRDAFNELLERDGSGRYRLKK
ncbi:MAG: hypothetical protein ABSC19_14480 [Syntrophorhabdales bacterium]|jgi:hypothetical protein